MSLTEEALNWGLPEAQHVRILEHRHEGRRQFDISAGKRIVERVVPPAGEEHAFDVQRWERRVTVYLSPTGRSVRVWVDGVEIKKP